MEPGPNVRPCEHGPYVLDDKWATVTCETCGEKLDPFSVLMYYAEWMQRFEQQRQMNVEASKRMLVESLRRLKRLRDATPDEVREIDAVLARRWSATEKELREIERRIDGAIRERKSNRRYQR